jgi:ubiquinone/menaquinone biosynthesis C-methylase UbiE
MRQVVWRAIYEVLAARVRRPEWSFMNYGYASRAPDDALLVLERRDEADRSCIALYRHAVAGAELAGKDVLEVGCGRGGGASYVSRYLGPRSVTGLDFSRAAVALCQATRAAPGLSFVVGDAQAMPFPDGSFDAVTNIESSHCYASMEAFLAEVSRVLRPGGDFLWADLRDRDKVDAVGRQLEESGLRLRELRDITANVLSALRGDNERKIALMDAWIPRAFHRVFRGFAGLEGTKNFAEFESGQKRYLSAWLVKDGPG